MARKYAMIFYDFTDTANSMEDDELANLVRAILNYGRGDDPAPFLKDRVSKLLFESQFKGQIDRNNDFDAKRGRSRVNSCYDVLSRVKPTNGNHNGNPNGNHNGNFLTVTQGGEKTDDPARLGNESVF